MMPLAKTAWRLLVLGVVASAAAAQAEEEPLHTLIDRHLAPPPGVEVQPCSDAEFLRRASLDLTGITPTADEARKFIAEPAPEKRVQLIDRLFASPQFARHFATMLDVMLMERRGNTHVSADDWQAWLLKAVKDNKPWNALAREVLAADGDDPAQRPAARFALDRGSEPNLVTRDIGRVFFGRDMQCAQCHDHPLVAEYLQSDYHGLMAFVAPTVPLVKTENGAQKTVQAEKAGGDLAFESVFVKTPRRTGARVPDGVVLDEPFFLPGDEYQVSPADNVKSVPKFSRRAKLAELATNGSNKAFNENIANRLWAMMFGRGLVYPVDMHHPDNPATDPELMRLLGQRFAAMNFDMRAFLRELALTSAYQRSYDLPARLLAAAQQANSEVAALEKQRTELEAASTAASEAYDKASQTWQEAEAAMMPVAAELDAARTQYTDSKKKFDEAVKALNDTRAQLQTKQIVVEPVAKAMAALQEAVKAAPDDPKLVETSQKLTARSQEITAEVAALSKSFEEKTAAIPAQTEALAKVTPTVGATFAKLVPLNAALHSAEQKMLKARDLASRSTAALAAIDRRLENTKTLAQLPALDQALVAAKAAVAAPEATVAVAQKKFDEAGATVAQHEAAVKAAAEAQGAASAQLVAARDTQDKQVKAVRVVTAAFVTATAAPRPVAFDDTMLTSTSSASEQTAVTTAAQTTAESPMDAAVAAEKAAAEALVAAQKSLEAAVAARTACAAECEAAKEALEKAKADVAAKQSAYDTAVSDVADRWTKDFAVASLKPLTPEQLCFTMFRATGIYDRNWQKAVAELDKSQPLTEEQKKDPAQLAARDVAIEQRTFDLLKGNIPTFIGLYAAAGGQPQGDFFATPDQALFATNGGSQTSWAAPAADNVTDRMIKATDPRVAAEELYLSLLTRLPSEEEIGAVVKHFASRTDDKPMAAQEMVWALLNSAEFRFNH